jgi:hypothetical protein
VLNNNLHASAYGGGQTVSIEAAEREVAMARELRHPHIVALRDVFYSSPDKERLVIVVRPVRAVRCAALCCALRCAALCCACVCMLAMMTVFNRSFCDALFVFLFAQWELVRGKDLLETINDLTPNMLPEPRARRYFKQARTTHTHTRGHSPHARVLMRAPALSFSCAAAVWRALHPRQRRVPPRHQAGELHDRSGQRHAQNHRLRYGTLSAHSTPRTHAMHARMHACTQACTASLPFLICAHAAMRPCRHDEAS